MRKSMKVKPKNGKTEKAETGVKGKNTIPVKVYGKNTNKSNNKENLNVNNHNYYNTKVKSPIGATSIC